MSGVRRAPDAADLELDPSGFADRIMATIETTPAPSPARSFVGAVSGWSLDDALASLAVAWHLATVRRWSVAPRVRARSMALVLAVAAVLATGSLVAAAAVRFAGPFGPDDRHAPPPTLPARGITDPELDDPDTTRADRPTSLDADHHVTEPVVEPVSGGQPVTKPVDGGTDAGDADDDRDHDIGPSGSDEGGDANESSGSGDGAHDGGSTSGSQESSGGDDGGARGSSGDEDGHDGHDSSSEGDDSHDGGDGGD